MPEVDRKFVRRVEAVVDKSSFQWDNVDPIELCAAVLQVAN